MGTVSGDVALHQKLPMSAVEGVQLVNNILVSRWNYRALFLRESAATEAQKYPHVSVEHCSTIAQTGRALPLVQ